MSLGVVRENVERLCVCSLEVHSNNNNNNIHVQKRFLLPYYGSVL